MKPRSPHRNLVTLGAGLAPFDRSERQPRVPARRAIPAETRQGSSLGMRDIGTTPWEILGFRGSTSRAGT